MSQTNPQLYKFQITGYEKSNPDTYMLGLGTIDDQNRFTGTLKHEKYDRDLSLQAEYDAKSDPVCAWYYAYNGYFFVGGFYFSVLVSSLPIANITLVQQQEQGVDPDETTKILLASEPATLSNSSRTLDTKKSPINPADIDSEYKQITADLLEALEAMCVTFGYKSYMTRDLDPEITTEAVIIKARNAITKAKGLNP